MANPALKSKIHDILRSGYFHDDTDAIYVSDGPDEDVHVVIVSPKFDGRGLREKHDLIWSEFVKGLEKDEWGMVSLSIGVGPEELKAM